MDSKTEIRSLTGLRGVAALTVALAHFRISLPYDLQTFVMWHNAAVDLFFILSGFTLCYVYRPDAKILPTGRYFVARVARIYPLYLLSILAVWVVYTNIVAGIEGYSGERLWRDVVAQILGVNAWPILGDGVHWNSPAWSVSVELFCYVAIFPLLFRVPIIRNSWLDAIGCAVLMSASYFAFVGFFDERLLDIVAHEPKSYFSYLVNPARGVLGFLAGWLLYGAFVQQNLLWRFCGKSADAVFLVFFAGLAGNYFDMWDMQAILIVMPFMVLGTAGEQGVVNRLLSTKVFHFLGEISYSIYLTHIILYCWFLLNVGPPEDWSVNTYLALITSLFVISSLSFYGLERPARGIIRKIFTRSSQPKGVIADISPGNQ